ncbi:hypothetical protein HG536_0E00660 [Torulaspora globosa]|uniref:Phosphatidylglycerophosphatase GEP4, mitochondrial n=1 Tax=Torulaspora globosa TaxID=48254 RepID=A0A7G3ZI20_9SACH|nr:uncharacterized protein HG536_0E00660 [Torulaspora globosa]QLL33156.1 hypothetical protein HG536_0E00660 [Torulaspora globosa]
MNASGTLNFFRLIWNPRLCMPHIWIATFNDLPVPINASIKAVVLDKDNCFAYPEDNKVWPAYREKWEQLKRQYPGKRLLIVSNTAGSNDDKGYKEAEKLEAITGVPVLRHATKKPGCRDEVIQYFTKNGVVSNPSEIAVVGDRLFTDIMMANQMGAYGVWVQDGVRKSTSSISRFEKTLYNYLKI